jgi:hypothetical protein
MQTEDRAEGIVWHVTVERIKASDEELNNVNIFVVYLTIYLIAVEYDV